MWTRPTTATLQHDIIYQYNHIQGTTMYHQSYGTLVKASRVLPVSLRPAGGRERSASSLLVLLEARVRL